MCLEKSEILRTCSKDQWEERCKYREMDSRTMQDQPPRSRGTRQSRFKRNAQYQVNNHQRRRHNAKKGTSRGQIFVARFFESKYHNSNLNVNALASPSRSRWLVLHGPTVHLSVFGSFLPLVLWTSPKNFTFFKAHGLQGFLGSPSLELWLLDGLLMDVGLW